MQSGCACRGAAGLAHVGCRVRAARALQEDKGWQVWWECQTCLQDFTGGMSAGLANAVWSEVRDQAEEEDERLVAASILAASLDAQGKHAQAEQIQREVHAALKRVLGPEHRDTLRAAGNLANSLHSQEQYVEAEQMGREVHAALERVLGPEHADTLTTAGNLVLFLADQGKDVEAKQMHREVHEVQTRVLGADHHSTALLFTPSRVIPMDPSHKYLIVLNELT